MAADARRSTPMLKMCWGYPRLSALICGQLLHGTDRLLAIVFRRLKRAIARIV
jgi:hypothetical protein